MPKVCLVLVLSLVPFAHLTRQDPLARVGWLAGCWESRNGGQVIMEMWSPPAGGLMVGASRTVAGGQARAWEHLRLRSDGEALVYTAIPSGQTETDFRSTAITDTSFVVENPEHDFPQRITYTRINADSAAALVEAKGPDGGMRGFSLAWSRVTCTTS
jgi:hypothetical protein